MKRDPNSSCCFFRQEVSQSFDLAVSLDPDDIINHDSESKSATKAEVHETFHFFTRIGWDMLHDNFTGMRPWPTQFFAFELKMRYLPYLCTSCPPRTFPAKFRRVYPFILKKSWSSKKSSDGLALFWFEGDILYTNTVNKIEKFEAQAV